MLENLIESKVVRADSVVLDVGASTGSATFSAAAMGVRVIALEPIFENVQRLCNGVYFNRASHLVKVHLAAASEIPSNMTMHKVGGSQSSESNSTDLVLIVIFGYSVVCESVF